MSSDRLHILYEDNHLLALNKPAGLATMGEPGGAPTLLTLAKEYIKRRYHKPGNVYLGVVSRVDSLVTGVVVFARTSKAAARLTEQFRTREVQKFYWAIVEGIVEPPSGECRDWMLKDEPAQRMRVVAPATPGAKAAELSYQRLNVQGGNSLLEIVLHTGRKHQIRVQLADRGHPILGDAKYGSRRKFPAGIALHARRLIFQHPVRREEMVLEAPLPTSWERIRQAGG